MKTLGVVGGIAPPSTIDYYRQLTSGYRARSPDGSYPSLLINSIEATAFFALLEAGDRAGLTDTAVAALDRLERGGAGAAIFASNTPHLVFDEIAARTSLPLISIVEETAAVAEERGYQRLGLIGARFTMEGGIYERAFERRGMSVVTPDAEGRAYVHERYFSELVEGQFLAETRAGMWRVIERMRAAHDIDAVILGGTELPLLFRDGGPPALPLLDTTSIHVEAALRWLLS